MARLEKTVERIIPKNFRTREEYLLFLRHLFAYEEIASRIPDDAVVLEVGFGEGYGTRVLAESSERVKAVDIHEPAVDYANDKYGGPNCTFVAYDGKNLPFDDNRFDVAVSLQVIEHVEDPDLFLSEIHRVLKPGGEIFITTPNRETRLEEDEEPWNPFHLREYSSPELRQLLLRHFSSARVLGVRGRMDIEEIEANRVRRSYSLYKLLPDSIKRLVTGNFLEQYDTEQFFTDHGEVGKSMDLFATAVKKQPG